VLRSHVLAGLDFSELLLAFAVLISSLTFHEAAHAWTADRLGDSTARMLGRLSLNPAVHVDLIGTIVFPLLAMVTGVPLLGWAKPVPVNMNNLQHPRRDFAIVALAGPVSNLILAAVGAVLINTLWGSSVATGLTTAIDALVFFASVNVMLAVFNMIPIPPLDGGNVLMGILPESLAQVVDQLRPWGFLLLYALMLSGILSTMVFPLQRAILNWLL
jgi:Zn-dependent protease